MNGQLIAHDDDDLGSYYETLDCRTYYIRTTYFWFLPDCTFTHPVDGG